MDSETPTTTLRDGQLLEAMECLRDGIVVFDERRRLVYHNQSYCDLYRPVGERWVTGTSLDQILRDTAVHLIGLEDEDEIDRWTRVRLEAYASDDAVFEHRFRDGRRIRATDHVMPGGWSVGIRTDVTEQRKAELDHAASEQRLRDILDSLPVGVSVKDTELKYLLINQGYARIYDLENERIEGETPLGVLGEDPKAAALRADHERVVIETGKPMAREAEHRGPNGRNKHLLVRKTPFLDSDGSVVGVCSAVTDISEQKQIEAELRRHRDHLEDLVEQRTREITMMHEELVRRERLGIIGQLTATVAHELRHPLGTIALSMNTLRRRLDDGREFPPGLLERIERNVSRANEIINELLTYTQLGPIERRDTDLVDVVEAVLEDHEFPDDVSVRRDLVSVSVSLDTGRFSRALSNVLTNAVHALEATDGRSRAKQLHISCGERSGEAFVTIADTGPGIPQRLRERVMEPLFSTKSFGTGLGLPIVQQVLDLHDGRLELGDEDGGGARVTLWVPIASSSTR